MSDGHQPGPGKELGDQLADLVVYAPLGLALEARRLLPELAARGRRQVLFTRTIGKFAVARGRRHVDDLLDTGTALFGAWLPWSTEADDASGPATDPGAPADDQEAGEDRTEAPPHDRPDATHLAIPDYDSLSAFQVMPRLEALEAGDLAAVRAYEEATRGRRTILNKIAQLG